MGKKITVYKVADLSKVNTTLYIEGDHFISGSDIGVLVNGEIKTIGEEPDIPELPDLSDYAKKEDIPDVSGFLTEDDLPEQPDLTEYAKTEDIPDVSGFLTESDLPEQPDLTEYAKTEDIPDVSGFLTESDVQQMIDDALGDDETGEEDA